YRQALDRLDRRMQNDARGPGCGIWVAKFRRTAKRGQSDSLDLRLRGFRAQDVRYEFERKQTETELSLQHHPGANESGIPLGENEQAQSRHQTDAPVLARVDRNLV